MNVSRNLILGAAMSKITSKPKIIKADLAAAYSQQIINWFKEHPNPTDPEVHAWAKSIGMTPEELEGEIYHIFTNFVRRNCVDFATYNKAISEGIPEPINGCGDAIALSGMKGTTNPTGINEGEPAYEAYDEVSSSNIIRAAVRRIKIKSAPIEGPINKGGFHKWLGKSEDSPITEADIERGLNSDDPHVVKMAQFAKNSRKWKHK